MLGLKKVGEALGAGDDGGDLGYEKEVSTLERLNKC